LILKRAGPFCCSVGEGARGLCCAFFEASASAGHEVAAQQRLRVPFMSLVAATINPTITLPSFR
jgi:hypothetical protein